MVAVVLAGMAFSHWSSTTDYAPLYTNLSGADAGKVTQALDTAGVKWKLADGGASVLVPSDEVYKQRVALSAQGLPGSEDGLALLDKEGITASEFVQRVDYQRAMQGELEKTIAAINGVAGVTVNLTIPPDQVFAGAEADKPSAAVLVQPACGSDLSGDAVQAIVHLVASSIPNMTPDAVTVADSNGNVLNAPGMDLSSSRGLQQQSAFDQQLSTAVSGFLATALGPNHADVHVQSDLNFDQKKTTSLTNTPPAGTGGKPIPQQQSTTEREVERRRERRRQRRARRDPGRSRRRDRRQRAVVLEGQQRHEQRDRPGVVRRAGGARQDQPAVGGGRARQRGGEARRARRLDQADPGRGRFRQDARRRRAGLDDRVQQGGAEGGQGTAEVRRHGSGQGGMLDLVRHVVTLLIIALVLFFAWRAIKKAESNRVPLRVPLDLRELEAADTRALEAAASTPRLSEIDRRALSPAADTGVEGELTDLIEQQPDEVAQTLRSWLADRRT